MLSIIIGLRSVYEIQALHQSLPPGGKVPNEVRRMRGKRVYRPLQSPPGGGASFPRGEALGAAVPKTKPRLATGFCAL